MTKPSGLLVNYKLDDDFYRLARAEPQAFRRDRLRSLKEGIWNSGRHQRRRFCLAFVDKEHAEAQNQEGDGQACRRNRDCCRFMSPNSGEEKEGA